jgi:hypothetical protein
MKMNGQQAIADQLHENFFVDSAVSEMSKAGRSPAPFVLKLHYGNSVDFE